ncbi:hypothetical protein PPSIR1_02416 [Plesiocystis pacifica SIR-1]|uniref:Tetratricopeptide repeat protein n=2 Tax=Plesiocystis pacifica TaxID=191768 RepID=A6G447_9BACT|nr:hypothetical protein PPSIR1_02416 [Plesiocystis pacifica SIR-1]
MQRWPAGLRPAGLTGRRDGVELIYCAASFGEVRVVAYPAREAGRVDLRVVPNPRLPEAVARRLSAGVGRVFAHSRADALPWLRRVLARCEAFEEAAEPGLDAALARCAEAATRARSDEGPSLPAAAVDALATRLPEAARDELEPRLALAHLQLCAGQLQGALDTLGGPGQGWPDVPAADASAESPRAAARRAVLAGTLGLRDAAIDHARRFAALARTTGELEFGGRLCAHLGLRDEACQQYAALIRVAPRPRHLAALLRAAEEADADGRQALAELAEHLGDDPLPWLPADLRVRLGRTLMELGAYPLAELQLRACAATSPDAAGKASATATLARARLWALDLDAAETLANEADDPNNPEHATALMVLGAVACLRGEPARGLDALERAHRLRGDDLEIRNWRVEALLRAGQPDAAQAAALEEGYRSAIVRQLLRVRLAAIHAARGHAAPEGPRDDTDYIHRTILRQLAQPLAALDADAAEAMTLGPEASDADTLAAVELALRALGGNRSNHLSLVGESDGRGGRSLHPAREVWSPRARASELQHRLLFEPLATVRERLAELVATYPGVPYGETYSAELLLWEGRYAEALEVFEAVWQRTHQRWSYVGSAAALHFLDRDDEALARWEEAATVHAFLPEEATHAYRSEIWRKRGALEAALEAASLAVEATNTRFGAWINLALIERRRGDRGAAEAALEVVRDNLQVQLALVARAEGLTVDDALELESAPVLLEALLRAMRGNRSSGVQTLVDDRGVLRIFTQRHLEGWTELASWCSEWSIHTLALLEHPSIGVVDVGQGGRGVVHDG